VRVGAAPAAPAARHFWSWPRVHLSHDPYAHNTRRECVARATLDRPTADQHTRAPHPTCSPSVSTGHGLCVSLAPRYLILGVSCNTLVFAARPSAVGWLSVTAQHAIDRLSSNPPLHSSVLLGHGMCDSHTLTLLLTGSHCSVCLGGFLHPALFC
jgi:hypothetical protein